MKKGCDCDVILILATVVVYYSISKGTEQIVEAIEKTVKPASVEASARGQDAN